MNTDKGLLSSDDKAIIDMGYKPQLHRSLGFYSSFSVAFSSMSVLMGVYANFGFALGKAGPFGFWTWPIVGCGQLLVALILAELAGRIPLTGAIYNWNTKLANPAVGWVSAWMLFVTYLLSLVGATTAMLMPIQTLVGQTFDPEHSLIIGICIIAVQAAINIYGVRLASHTNKIAVSAEILAIIGFGTALLIAVVSTHQTHISYLTTMPKQPESYWYGFAMASLLGAWTLLGFEASSDLSEETLNVRRTTPKAIVSAVIISMILGGFLLTILAISIPNVAEITAASDPISVIMAHHLGDAAARWFLAIVLIALFAVSLMIMAAASRILFAIARDQHMPAWRHLTKVSSHKVPVAATLLVAIVEAVIFCVAKDATDLFTSSAILFFLVYLVTVISYAIGIKKLPLSQSFSLGRFRWPIIIIAILWLLTEIAILTLPEDFHTAALIAAAVVIFAIISCFFHKRLTQKGIESEYQTSSL